MCEEAARRYRAGESIQVLSPVRVKTGFSVQALNTRLQNEVNPLTAEKPTWGKFRDGDRVIVTQNSAYYNICNGDVGVLHIRGENFQRKNSIFPFFRVKLCSRYPETQQV